MQSIYLTRHNLSRAAAKSQQLTLKKGGKLRIPNARKLFEEIAANQEYIEAHNAVLPTYSRERIKTLDKEHIPYEATRGPFHDSYDESCGLTLRVFKDKIQFFVMKGLTPFEWEFQNIYKLKEAIVED